MSWIPASQILDIYYKTQSNGRTNRYISKYVLKLVLDLVLDLVLVSTRYTTLPGTHPYTTPGTPLPTPPSSMYTADVVRGVHAVSIWSWGSNPSTNSLGAWISGTLEV